MLCLYQNLDSGGRRGGFGWKRILREAANAGIVSDALRHFDGQRYELASFVVMPNHVHVLFHPLGEHRLEDILKSWKGFTAREINKRTGRKGALWQEEYWNRLVRSERHFWKYAGYIRENPGTAGLREGFLVWPEENGARVFEPVGGGLGEPGLESPGSVVGGQESPRSFLRGAFMR